MLFNSFHYLIFFPIVVFGYFSVPRKLRWILLLLASYYFYMCWKPEYVFLLLFSTLTTYWCGLKIGAIKKLRLKKSILVLGLFVNFGVLFIFKYLDFIDESLEIVINKFNIFLDLPSFDLLLPIGISFYTFQSVSYMIDVYRGEKSPEKHLGIYALYVSFFPQLVAGPIERSTRLLPQFFRKDKNVSSEDVSHGLKLILLGFFKKVVIADRLAILVDTVYGNPGNYDGIGLSVATVFFAFQIYCDFSGYSDIAIGSARIMGYKLMNNFDRPYISKSIREFWRRWHISLSTWFRDYLYIPLGGNRVQKRRWYFNIIFVFAVCGIWHGANWTFAMWGVLHGFYYICSAVTLDVREKMYALLGLDGIKKYVKVTYTFLLVCIAWIFFRADNISDAFYIFSNLHVGWMNIANGGALVETVKSWGMNKYDLIIAFFSIVVLQIIEWMQDNEYFKNQFDKYFLIRWPAYFVGFWTILILGLFNDKQFIYFVF